MFDIDFFTLKITDANCMHERDVKLLYKIFDWKIKDNKFEINNPNKLIDLKNIQNIEAYVAPSNYKLITDLHHTSKKIIYKNTKKEKIKVNIDRSIQLMSNYLKRSYLSYYLFEDLIKFGFKRIENFVILLALQRYSDFYKLNDMFLDKNKKDIYNIKILDSSTFTYDFELNIKNLIFYRGLEVIDEVLFLYDTGYISDPFDEKIEIIKNVDRVCDILKIDKKYLNKKITISKEVLLINNKEKQYLFSDDIFISKYLDISTISYGDTKKTIHKSLSKQAFWLFLMKFLKNLRDIAYNLRFLYNADLIDNNFNLRLQNKINIYKNIEYLDIEKWNKFYNQLNYSISSFNSIQDDFTPICPVCKNNEFGESFTNFYCKNQKCDFVVKRNISQKMGFEKLSYHHFISLLRNRFCLLRNKNGYNNILFLYKLDKERNIFGLAYKK